MNLLLCGMWHLGCVTAACISEFHPTVASDPDATIVAGLRLGDSPIAEPEMTEALRARIAEGRLTFVDDARAAAPDADVVWFTFDTPVDDHDNADVEFVLGTAESILPFVKPNALIVMTSQIPIGSCARLQLSAKRLRPEATIRFACIPENLRLGQAMGIFRHPDRVAAGVDGPETRAQVEALYAPMGDIRIEFMSLASAEMTKHSINAFLAMSLSFINEIAALCERTGADSAEVERGLRSESRIGPRAYVSPGPGYAGGTLARDIIYLTDAAKREGTFHRLIETVNESNDVHRQWMFATVLESLSGDVRGKRIAVWGLTYKPGTNTLRRSTAVEVCERLAGAGAIVTAFDPSIDALPEELGAKISLAATAIDSCRDADALLVCTEWPQFREVDAQAALASMRSSVVIDPKRFVIDRFAAASSYRGIGVPRSSALSQR